MEVYRRLLDDHIKPELAKEKQFVLEEDGDSGHGHGSKTNVVAKWKEDNHLQWYKNIPHSPDLAPIENCWQPPKQYVQSQAHWDDDTLKELILEGWEQVSQEFINERVLSMPRRLQDVIDSGGKMTGW